jgi:hypothetical protein
MLQNNGQKVIVKFNFCANSTPELLEIHEGITAAADAVEFYCNEVF